jgi:hypothetical protein
MKLYYQPSGLTHGLDFLIANDWTPQQAFAVVELLDDLRDRIYAQYGTGLFELLRDPGPKSRRSNRCQPSNPQGALTGPSFVHSISPAFSAILLRHLCALPSSH